MFVGLVVIVLILLGFGFYVFSTQKQVKKAVSQITPVKVKISTESATVASAPEGVSKNPIQLIGTVRLADPKLDCWVIEPQKNSCKGNKCPLSDPPNYQIINMAPALKKAGIKVTFSLEIQEKTVTTCNTGPEVRILNYEIL